MPANDCEIERSNDGKPRCLFSRCSVFFSVMRRERESFLGDAVSGAYLEGLNNSAHPPFPTISSLLLLSLSSPPHPHPPSPSPFPFFFCPDSRYVVVVLGLVRPTLLAGVGVGAGRLRSVPVLPRARVAGCPQVEQQNSPASPAGGQCELQR